MDNLLGIPETLLPEDPAANRLDEGVSAAEVAAAHLTSSLAWAELAAAALARAAGEIGEVEEEERCRTFLHDRSEERRVGKECRSRWSP